MTDEQMKEYNKLKEQRQSQLDRQNKYNKEHYERLNIVLPKGQKKRVEEAAEKSGYKSINQYIRRLINDDFRRLGWEIINDTEKTPPQAPERPTEPRKEDKPRRESVNPEIANMTNSELNEWLQKRQVENAQKRSLQGRLTGIDMSDR